MLIIHIYYHPDLGVRVMTIQSTFLQSKIYINSKIYYNNEIYSNRSSDNEFFIAWTEHESIIYRLVFTPVVNHQNVNINSQNNSANSEPTSPINLT